MMKALSVKQPWAWLICGGFPLTETVDNDDGSKSARLSGKCVLKDVENRNWPTKYRGRIYVHAPQRFDGNAWEWLANKGFSVFISLMMCGGKILPRGAIVGEVDIVDCVEESDSGWFEGPYGFVLKNPTLYENPIPYKGKRGLFEISELK